MHRALPFGDDLLDLPKHVFARIARHGAHDPFQRLRRHRAHQPAHRLTGERRSAACDRLVHDAQRVAHRAVARLRQHCEGIIIYCNAFAPGDIA